MGDENKKHQGDIGLVGDILNMGYDYYQQAEAREFAAEEAQNNRDFQSDMYNRQLSDSINWRTHQENYNSPSAQMQRFADAGINPMYFVTGSNGGTNVHTPSITGGFGSTPVTPHHSTGRINVESAIRMQNETKIANAQALMLDAQASKFNAEALNISNLAEISGLDADIAKTLRKTYVGEYGENGSSYAQIAAAASLESKRMELMLAGKKFESENARMNSIIATAYHNNQMQEFVRSLNETQRQILHNNLKVAIYQGNLADFLDKMKKYDWWLDAGTQVVGSVAGAINAAKGTSIAPINSSSRSYNESHSDNTSHNFNYNIK